MILHRYDFMEVPFFQIFSHVDLLFSLEFYLVWYGLSSAHSLKYIFLIIRISLKSTKMQSQLEIYFLLELSVVNHIRLYPCCDSVSLIIVIGASLEGRCCCSNMSAGCYYFSAEIQEKKSILGAKKSSSHLGKGCHAVLVFSRGYFK